MWTVKVQMRLHTHAVYSEQSLFIDIYYNYHWFIRRTTKAQISLCKCTGWSGPALTANCIRTLFCVLPIIMKLMCTSVPSISVIIRVTTRCTTSLVAVWSTPVTTVITVSDVSIITHWIWTFPLGLCKHRLQCWRSIDQSRSILGTDQSRSVLKYWPIKISIKEVLTNQD